METLSTIRVMRIITRLNIGGPAYQAIYLTERLNDSRYETRLVVGSVGASEGSMESLARERGVAFTHVSGLGREISLKSDGITVGRLYREIRRFRPHIVHTHLAKAGAVGRLAAIMARTPVIVHTYHGHVFHGYFSPRKTRIFLAIERFLARFTDRIVVLSDDQKREILGYGVGRAEQMASIPLGLELEPFLRAEERRGELRKELGLGADTPIVGIVARLVPIKAHDLFLQAARLLAERMPQARFLIVGDGEMRAALEEQARRLGLLADTRVMFLGFRSDLPRIYADLDVAVVCSHNEGMPVTIIEALASARPVVATEVGAVRSLIAPGETGLLVPKADAAALADAMMEQLQNRVQADRMAKAGREHVYPRLSVSRLESDIRELYQDLIGQKRAGGRAMPVGVAR